jgi:glycosyltransferase involved in cell wall biosynthesis
MYKIPTISILMPVHNTDNFLEKSIQSCIDQSFNDWELICINDGSTDKSLDILKDFALRDNRINVFSQEKSGTGHAQPLNKALSLSKGKYVFSLDSDDYLSADLLFNSYTRITELGADVCIPDMAFVNLDGKVINMLNGYNGNRSVILSNKQAVELSLDWKIHAKGLWNGDLFRRLKFDEEGFSAEYSSRVHFLNCNKIIFSEGTYFYIQHEHAITKKFGIRLFYYLELDNKVKKLLIENNFNHQTLADFEYNRFERLISKCLLYYENKEKLLKVQKKEVTALMRKSFKNLDKKLLQGRINSFPIRRRIKFKLILCQLFVFKVYCIIKLALYNKRIKL